LSRSAEMSDPAKKVVPLEARRAGAGQARRRIFLSTPYIYHKRLMVTITVGELRSLVDEILDEKLRRLGAGRNNGLLTVEQETDPPPATPLESPPHASLINCPST